MTEKILSFYSYYKRLAVWQIMMPPGRRPIWTPGAWLAGFIKGITKHCYTHKGSRPDGFSYCKSMRANDPRDVADLDPRDMTGRVNVGYHQTWLHTKYTGFRPCGFI